MKKILFLVFLGLIIVSSCKKDKTNISPIEGSQKITKIDTTQKNELQQTITNEDTSIKPTMMSSTRPQSKIKTCKTLEKFNLPDPLEFFRNVSELQPDFEFLLPVSEADKFQTTVQKSVGLGIFITDMTYASMFLNHEKTLEYLKTISALSNDIGLSEIINDNELKNLDIETDTDSVQIIMSRIINRVCNVMEKNDFNEVMPFVFYSSWLEANYLMVNYLYKVQSADYLLKQLGKQPETIKNMKDYINDAMLGIGSYDINKKLQLIINQLDEIFKVYNKIYQTTDIILSKNQLEDLLKVLEKSRTELINQF